MTDLINYPEAWKPSSDAWTERTPAPPKRRREAKPAPPRPYVECCAPVWMQFPSGRYWAHSKFCPVNRLQKIDAELEASIAAHPAKGDRLSRLKLALSHELDCECDDCTYFFAASDEDDDYYVGRRYANGREDL